MILRLPLAPSRGRTLRAILQLSLVVGPLALGGCDLTNDAGWVRFNADGQTVALSVGPDAPSEDGELTLLSTTESVEVGSLTVSPGGGPVGTEHAIVVVVEDDFEDQVDRVTLVTRGDRGSQTHLLVQDSADPGLWQIDIVSLGADDEVREDELLLRLWTPAADGQDPDPEAEVDED